MKQQVVFNFFIFFFFLTSGFATRKLDGLELLLSMRHQFDDPTDDAYLHTTARPNFNPDDPQQYYENQNNQIEANQRFEQDSSESFYYSNKLLNELTTIELIQDI